MAEEDKDPESPEKKPASPWPSARKSQTSIAPAAPASAPAVEAESDAPRKAAWGAPLDRFDRVWTKFEARLCASVLVAEILTLVIWIAIKAMASTGRGGPGQIFRYLASALLFGVVAHRLFKKHPRHQAITAVAAYFGAVLTRFAPDAGVEYFANLLAWIQNASIFVFVGGFGELAKRFTLWLALLGASIATAQGKHINVDVVMRFLSPKARVPVAVLGWMVAALVSFTGSWGFFDSVAVEEFRAPTTAPCPEDSAKTCPTPWQSRVSVVAEDTRRNMFLAGRQLSLDIQTLPRVLGGAPYAKWLTPKEWNAWVLDGGWDSHFKPEDVKSLLLPEDGSVEFRNPAVTSIPGATESVPNLLVPLFNFVFSFGLLMIAIRFVLRSLLAISGWIKVDPDAAHGEEELAHIHDHSASAEAIEAATKEAVR